MIRFHKFLFKIYIQKFADTKKIKELCHCNGSHLPMLVGNEIKRECCENQQQFPLLYVPVLS